MNQKNYWEANMGGTKIIVLQLKQIIKACLFALIGILAIILLIFLFVPKTPRENAGALYVPGTYQADIMLQDTPVAVKVTVSDKAIQSVTMDNLAETQAVFYPLFPSAMSTVASEVVARQSTDFTPTGDYPVTAQVLLNAIQQAVDQAKVETKAAKAE